MQDHHLCENGSFLSMSVECVVQQNVEAEEKSQKAQLSTHVSIQSISVHLHVPHTIIWQILHKEGLSEYHNPGYSKS